MILEITGILQVISSLVLIVHSVKKRPKEEKTQTFDRVLKYRGRLLKGIAYDIARESNRDDPTGNDLINAEKKIAEMPKEWFYIVSTFLGEEVKTNGTLYKLKLGVGVSFLFIGGLILLIASMASI